jgi:23S rRNA (guanine745-N1)-methyltransferase
MRAAWDVLACSVRGCARPLTRVEQRFVCPTGHAFDLARSGYLNLLQPQDRRSLQAGDPKATVQARLRLRERGLGAAVDEALERLAATHGVGEAAAIVELGCGTGDHLADLAGDRDRRCVGFDLSVTAIEVAARRHVVGAWSVANCDRVLPVRTASVDVVLSIDARRPRGEIARILKPDGLLLVAVPGPGDLRELRAATLEDARDLPGLTRVADEFAGSFELVAKQRTSEGLEFDAEGLHDLSLATYRNARRREDARLDTLDSLRVTIVHDVGVFRRLPR